MLISNSLSFYKEEVLSETDTYTHIRARVEQLAPVEVIRLLAQETLECARTLDIMVEGDEELKAIWSSFSDVGKQSRFFSGLLLTEEQGIIEFHMNTKRYMTAELLL